MFSPLAFNKESIVTDGLVFYVDAADRSSFSPGSGTWKDLTGNGNDGTLVNGPTFDSGNGGSIEFDGSDDRADLPNIPDIFSISGSQATIGIFAKINSVSSGGQNREPLISKPGPPWEWAVYAYYDNNNPTTRARFGISTWQSSGGNHMEPRENSPGSIILGQWHYFLAIIDDINLINTAYLDNEKIFSASGAIGNMGIGGNAPTIASRGGGQYLDCDIACIHINRKVLTPQEITQNYNALKGRFGL